MVKWAWLLAALSFLVVLASVVLRLEAGYPPCADTPGCVAGAANLWGWQLPVAAIRSAHRGAASTALLLAIFLAWACRRSPLARDSLALVLLMLFLAVVGVTGSGPDAVWGRFANILGGLALLALSGRLALAASAPAAAPSSPAAPAVLRAGLVALAATFVLGSVIGARYAAAACMSLPDCAGSAWPSAAGWSGLDPRRVLSPVPLPVEALLALHLLHRYCAGAAVLLLGIAGARGLGNPATRGASLWLLVLLALEVVLGGLTAKTGAGLVPATGHALVAGLLLIAIHRLRSAGRR